MKSDYTKHNLKGEVSCK